MARTAGTPQSSPLTFTNDESTIEFGTGGSLYTCQLSAYTCGRGGRGADGWEHLYLYDGITGKVKNQITRGDRVVRKVIDVGKAKGQIVFEAGGMMPAAGSLLRAELPHQLRRHWAYPADRGEMLYIPRQNHAWGLGSGHYQDYYFVHALLGVEPPDWNKVSLPDLAADPLSGN